MKRLILGLCAAALIACGGGGGKGSTVGSSATVRAYSAARWVPANASYAITARTVRDAQLGFKDLLETFGMAAEATPAEVGRALEQVLLVNPLSAEALAHIGIDVDGGFAMFSEHLNPTVVVHLASAADFQAFIARQTKLNMQSVVIDKTEVFTTRVDDDLRISWAVADDWLWVHFAFVADDGESWFTQSRASRGQWSIDLSGVAAVASPAIVGFADGARFLREALREEPELARCVERLQLGPQAVGNLTLAAAHDASQTSFHLALDVGPVIAAGLERSLIGPPEGWFTATQQVPIAAQWNADLAAARGKLEPCLQAIGLDLASFDDLGVRTARAFVRSFDPDERKGTGVVAMDLSHKEFFAAQLDQIPLRSTLERKRTFGPHAGKHLSIPMFVSVDYVLTDQLALAGIGDGLLAVVVGKGGSVRGPIAELAVQPQGLSMESWIELLRLAGANKAEAKQIATQLQSWRQARITLTLEGPQLRLALTGTRR